MADWIAECCTTDPQDEAASGVLYRSWAAWAEAAREFVGSRKAFSQSLRTRG
jgi:phage/plasmid-associated DNA primase